MEKNNYYYIYITNRLIKGNNIHTCSTTDEALEYINKSNRFVIRDVISDNVGNICGFLVLEQQTVQFK